MPIKSKNISEQAYLHIRESLLNSGVYVGQKIPHQELGQKLGISHTPLREALFRLSAEGLLTHENYKGFSVAAITLEEAQEIYEAREIIEPYLAQQAASQMTPAKAKAFRKIMTAYKQLMKEPYHRKRILTDKKFHLEIARMAGNNTLTQLLTQMYDKLIFKSPVEQLSTKRSKEAIKEHMEILKSLEQNNGKKAATTMRNHVRGQRDYVIQSIIAKQNSSQTINPLVKVKA
jgi:DNA-binding GntR family transcriptional regulator